MPGFKDLTAENWREPDPVMATFGRFSEVTRRPSQMTDQDWVRGFLSVQLGAQVPEAVRDLFAVARGTMLYGWFFYPLFHVGEGQLYRVVETAARIRYEQLGGPLREPRFSSALDYLVENGEIASDDRIGWDAAREMRNRASHPENVVIMTPGAVLGVLQRTAHMLNRLFVQSQLGR